MTSVRSRRCRHSPVRRAALYWHNGRSLGQTAESARVAAGILAAAPETAVACITGASKGLDRFPEEVDIVKLPSFRNYDTPAGVVREPVLPLTEREFFRIREELIATFCRTFRPHAFVVNHLPQGCSSELVSVLPERRYDLNVLTLRGILHDVETTNNDYFTPERCAWIAEHFDVIPIHNDPSVFRLEEHYAIPDYLVERFHYSGYVVSSATLGRGEARQALGVRGSACLAVVSMGGGQGAIEIWHSVVRAFASLDDVIDECLFVAGPYLELDQFNELAALVERVPHGNLVRYTPDLGTWMAAADVFVGAAGHNMIGEVLASRANAILIPRQLQELEQLMHATLLAERGLVRMATMGRLDDELLPLLSDALAEPLDPSHGVKLDGGLETGRLLAQLLDER
jgi:predicted glycosyltransferase